MRKLLRRYSWTRGTAVKKKEPLLVERLPAILAMADDLPGRDQALALGVADGLVQAYETSTDPFS